VALVARDPHTPFRVVYVGSSDDSALDTVEFLRSEFSVDSVCAGTVTDDGVRAMICTRDAVLVDTRVLPSGERARLAVDLVRLLLSVERPPKVVALIEGKDEETACAVAAVGVWDVVAWEEGLKPVADRLRSAARLHRFELAGRRSEYVRAAKQPALVEPRAEESNAPAGAAPIQMIGSSPEMRQVFSLIRRVAVTDVPVLVTGESGTGKELAAMAIHERSTRAQGPFVPISCAAIPEQLLESELFGHERGAFTGATRAHAGRVEAAAGGTLFLDEIGELSSAIQVKLLRFLEDHVVERVGGHRRIALDVRVIAATNRNLGDSVAQGGFREDLYYRLAVFTLQLPPLRDRGDDVLLMARHFLRRYAQECNRGLVGFSHDALLSITQAPWPGNVRELINRIRRAVVVADGPAVTAADLGLADAAPQPEPTTLRDARHRAEIESLRSALLRAGGNRSEAARLLGIGRTQLYELLRRCGYPDSELH
jgi:two-component system NtrC family response regulator